MTNFDRFTNLNVIGFILIAAIVIAVIIFFVNKKSNERKEEFGFGGLPSTTWKTEVVTAGSKQALQKGDFYAVPGTYQAQLSPRFSNVDFGGHLRSKMPDLGKMASPSDPLYYNPTKPLTENYEYQPCGQGGAQNEILSSRNNLSVHNNTKKLASMVSDDKMYSSLASAEQDMFKNNVEYPEPTDMIPIGDMTTTNVMGEVSQPVSAVRFYYANRNNRLRSLADPIRGDLPITPCTSDWFRPSVHPHIDLNQGAMNVMGGRDNETSQAMATLLNRTSGATTIGGVDLMAQKNISLGAGLADVVVTAY